MTLEAPFSARSSLSLCPSVHSFSNGDDPGSVIALQNHEHQVDAGSGNGGQQKNRKLAEADRCQNGQQAERDDDFVHKLRLAHGLGDLLPCVQSGIKERGVEGGHVPLPLMHLKSIIQSAFRRGDLEPGSADIDVIPHNELKKPAHCQTHAEMIGYGAAGDRQRKERLSSGGG